MLQHVKSLKLRGEKLTLRKLKRKSNGFSESDILIKITIFKTTLGILI